MKKADDTSQYDFELAIQIHTPYGKFVTFGCRTLKDDWEVITYNTTIKQLISYPDNLARKILTGLVDWETLWRL